MRKCALLVLTVVVLVLGMAVSASAETINVLAGCSATQESNFSSTSYLASAGVDGDYDYAHNTARHHVPTWWKVDMGADRLVDEVWAYYRDTYTCRERAYNYTLQVLDVNDNVLYDSQAVDGFTFNPWDGTGTYPDPGFGPAIFHLSTPVTGRKIQISKAGHDNLPGAYDETLDCWEYELRKDDGLTGPNVAVGAAVTVVGDGGGHYTSTNCSAHPSNLTDDSLGSWCSTDTEVAEPELYAYQIDLGSSYNNLEMIKIYPRQGAQFVAGGAYVKRFGDYVVSLHDDDGGAPAATANWTYNRTGQFAAGLSVADIFTPGMDPTGTFAGQWIVVEATDTHLDNNTSGSARGFCCHQISEVRAFIPEAFIPEPSTLVLLVAGVLAMLVRRQRS